MAVEREAKFRVDSHEPLRQRLAAGGAQRAGSVLETNLIFDRADAALRGQGVGLRVRESRDLDTGECLTTITLKGPVKPGPFKSREELETTVGDLHTAATILDALGFVRVLEYQKRRESWRFGECRIELDEPPHIGLFVEIEGPSDAAIDDVRRALEMQHVPHVKQPYPAMLMAYCEDHSVADRTLPLHTSALGGS
ncbi:MAG: class IV adenylate cyclase [Phycisphaerae bacterium]|jgi:predicted adenylyl cyclase CyaB